MDTTEQLNETHFYQGVHNLTPQELLFWVLLDETEKQPGVQNMGAVAGIILGNNTLTYRESRSRQRQARQLHQFFSAGTCPVNFGSAICRP